MKTAFGDGEQVLQRLRASLGDNPQPVAPLRPAWQRALRVVVAGVILAAATVAFMGLRFDAVSMGPTTIWAFSALQLLSVYFLAWLTLQETIPGARPTRAAVWSTAAGAVLVHLAVVIVSDRVSTTPLPEELTLRLAFVCLGFVTALGLPLAVVAVRLVRKGLPDDWLPLGLQVGLLAGLAAESGWRLHCPYSDWRHILSAHSGGILVLTLAGALVGRFWLNRRR